MNKTSYILFLLLLFLIDNVSADTTKKSHNPFDVGNVLESNFTETIDVEWSGGLPLIDVVIGVETHKFLFDTGAVNTVPVSLVKKLNLNPLEKAVSVRDAAGGITKTQMYTLPMIQIGGIHFSNFTVLANDFQSQFPLSCLGFNGIIGINAVKDLHIKLDLANANIVISDNPFDTFGYITTDFNNGQLGGINFDINFEFGHAPFKLDTGKNGYMQIGDVTVIPVLEKHKYRKRKKKGQFSSNIYGINSNVVESQYLVRNINIDHKIEILSMPVSVDNSKSLLIGNRLLKYFDIVVNMPNNKISFKKKLDKSIDDGFQDTFGFTPMWNKRDKLYISAITEETPAHKSGLKIGDRVILINDRNTKDFTKEEFCTLVKKLSAGESSFDSGKDLDISVMGKHGDVRHYHLSKP